MKVFKSEGLYVRLCHKFFTLRNALRMKNKTQATCNMTACPLRDIKLCFQRKAIYQVTCTKCNSKYIGCTIRDLHQRIKEHVTRKESSVFQHVNRCKRDITTEIIGRDNDATNLKLRKYLMIPNCFRL